MSKRVLKWVVPVDDQRHEIGAGAIVSIGHQGSVNEVVVWTEEDADRDVTRKVYAQIYGTGHSYPDSGVALGSVVHMAGTTPNPRSGAYPLLSDIVWHLVVFPRA